MNREPGQQWRDGFCNYQPCCGKNPCELGPAGMKKLPPPPSSVTLDKPRRPMQCSTWCALHRGGTTCDCDWFEKEGRS